MAWKRSPEVQRQYNRLHQLKVFIRNGHMERAKEYAAEHGLDINDPKVAYIPKEMDPIPTAVPIAERLSEERAYLMMQMAPSLVEKVEEQASAAREPAPERIKTREDQAREENAVRDSYKYPDFVPPRDPVPAGVEYALVTGEYGNSLMKKIQFDNGMRATLHVTRRMADKVLHRTFPVTENPDNRQGGFVIWNRP
jgi:hypothetical protein